MISLTHSFETTFYIFTASIIILVFIDAALLIRHLYRKYRKRKNQSKTDKPEEHSSPHEIPAHSEIHIPITNPFSPEEKRMKKLWKGIKKRISDSRFKPLLKKIKSFGSSIKRFIKKVVEFVKKIIRPTKPVVKFFYRAKWIILNVAFLLFIPYLFYDMFVVPLNVNYQIPAMDTVWYDQEHAFEIEFDRPFDSKKIGHDIFPEIKGEWVYESNGISQFKRKIKFLPEESILPENKVQVYISNISNYLQTKPAWDKTMDFVSAPVPQIENTYPENGGADFGITEEIILTLDEPDTGAIRWEATIEPEVEFEIIRNINPDQDLENRKEIRIRFDKPLTQSTQYTLFLDKIPQAYNIKTGEVLITEESIIEKPLLFTTIKAAAVSNIEPQGQGVLVDQNIRIVFDFEMVQEEVEENLSIEPAFEYNISWEDGKVLIIDPIEDFPKETTYTLRLPSGLHNLKGGFSEEALEHIFTTIGKVQVTSSSPPNNTSSRSINSKIYVTFNQEVDHASAQSKFSVSPGIAGSFSWDGNTMIFSPNGSLPYQTTYNVNVAAGVKTIHGIDGEAAHSFRFTTESQVFTLNIPYSSQPYRYACNLTAAKMALAYKGVSRSVDSLYSQIAKDNTPYDAGSNTWGNPNAGFVGDLTGSSKGYGVHWGPVRNLIAANGRSAEVKSGWNVTGMLQEVQAGNAVIIWAHNGYSGSGANTTWNLSGGGSVYTVRGMHSYVIRGFVGSAENPTSIMFSDPNRGLWTVSIGYFNSLWGTFNRTAVVVR
ncbi:MAG TPA: Ig-like domain-containing protein [Candidatus Dojkabacteria bacterium]